MNTGKLLTVAAVGGAAWWIYSKFSASNLGWTEKPVTLPSGGTVVPVDKTPVPLAKTPAVPVDPTVWSRIATAAGKDPCWPMCNTDQFNYYFADVRGRPGPAPEDLFPSNPRDQKYTLAEYQAAMTAKGFGWAPRLRFPATGHYVRAQ
jgi:hypothetical protein